MAKWFNKATVQAQLIAAIPVVLIGFFSLLFSFLFFNATFKQTGENFRNQNSLDSSNSAHQDSSIRHQLSLLESQIDIANRQMKLDSTYQSKEVEIQKNQLAILRLQQTQSDRAT